MKEYELTVLIHPDLEVDIDAPLAKVRDIVTSAGGKITTEDNWGKKKLAYRIKNEDFAVYVYMDVSLPADAPLKISNTLNRATYCGWPATQVYIINNKIGTGMGGSDTRAVVKAAGNIKGYP